MFDAAIHQPRIDASEGAVVIGGVRLPAATRKTMLLRFARAASLRLQSLADPAGPRGAEI